MTWSACSRNIRVVRRPLEATAWCAVPHEHQAARQRCPHATNALQRTCRNNITGWPCTGSKRQHACGTYLEFQLQTTTQEDCCQCRCSKLHTPFVWKCCHDPARHVGQQETTTKHANHPGYSKLRSNKHAKSCFRAQVCASTALSLLLEHLHCCKHTLTPALQAY